MAMEGSTRKKDKSRHGNIYGYEASDINGHMISMKDYKGMVLLITNVASQSSITLENYQNLESLYKKHKDSHFTILAFPCNQFAHQEAEGEEVIKQFVKRLNVSFPLFGKVKVNGEDAHPLWKFLKSEIHGSMGEFVKWNFTKFLLNTKGVPVKRYDPEISFSTIDKDILELLK